MRLRALLALLATSVPLHAAPAPARPGGTGTVRSHPVAAESGADLRASLVRLVAKMTEGSGLHIDEDSARLTLAGSPQTGGNLLATPLWTEHDLAAGGPLAFGLKRAGASARGDGPTVQATLSVVVRRDAWAAHRRIRKGEALSCSDFAPVRRNVRLLPRDALGASCALPADVVALRALGAGDILHAADVGYAPAVAAGAPVRLLVHAGAVAIVARATALNDGNPGDALVVRMTDPARTLKAQVTGPGEAALSEDLR